MATIQPIGPPKFGPGVNGQGPVTVRDWEIFYRWLTVVSLQVGNGVINNETPAGTIDGVNAVFTLTNAPNPTSSLQLFLTGVMQLQGTDYTLAGSTITFSSAPGAGSWITAYYRHI